MGETEKQAIGELFAVGDDGKGFSEKELSGAAKPYFSGEQTENAYLAHKRLYDNAVCDAIKIRDGYRLFESEVRKKQQETRSLRTRLQRVRLQEQIVQLDSRYTAGAEKEEALRSLRKAVQEKCTMAESRAAEQTDLISRNSSRKKAIEKTEALLTVGKESEAAQQSG